VSLHNPGILTGFELRLMTFAESRISPEIALRYDSHYHITTNISFGGSVVLLKAMRSLLSLQEAVNASHCSAYGAKPSPYLLPQPVPGVVGSLPTLGSGIISYLNGESHCTKVRSASLLNKSCLAGQTLAE